MKRILLVKTSSLGDVVHNLPVASDIRAGLPGVTIDWAVEEAFAGIPRLHPGVGGVLPAAVRRWRASLFTGITREQIRAFAAELKRHEYDAVIDTQGLLKSAWIARLARGPRHGLDFASSREPLALFYDRTWSIPWTLHAVERNRLLAARVLGYALPAQVDYGIAAAAAAYDWLPEGRYAVLLHATSAASKLWPAERWIELARRLGGKGVHGVLPGGSVAERARAEAIARAVPGAIAAPALSLTGAAALLAGSHAVVGVDTGLTHLAVALQKPTVGIYCATDPAATGLYGSPRAVNLGGIGRPPAVDEVFATVERLTEK